MKAFHSIFVACSLIGVLFSGDSAQADLATGPTSAQPLKETREFSSSGIGDEDLVAAERAMVRGDYRDAVRELVPAAGRGNPKAQSLLGALYQSGQGVERDLSIAASLYAEAAEAGEVDAQFNLANMYLLGEGVLPDDGRARHWYERAAAQGHQGALQNLESLVKADGQQIAIVHAIPVEDRPELVNEVATADVEPIIDHIEPELVPTIESSPALSEEQTALASAAQQLAVGNNSVAFSEYESLAQRGSAEAQFALGAMYQQGLGVEANESWTVTWYRRASEQGHTEAGARLRAIYAGTDSDRVVSQAPDGISNGIVDAASDEMAAGEIAADATLAVHSNDTTIPENTDALAATGTVTATPRNTMVAKLGGGVKSLFGRLVRQKKSGEIPKPGAPVVELDTGVNADAVLEAAEAEVTQGSDQNTRQKVVEIEIAKVAKVALVQEDYITAFELFSILAARGDAEAQLHLGYLHSAGAGVSREPAEAARWYRAAAAQGNAEAQYALAVAHAFGDGVTQSDVEAVKWYRLAADQNHRKAQFSLAISHATGAGTPQSDIDAVKWYRSAAEQGHSSAQYNLAYMYRSGKGVAQDHGEAVRWYQRAASQDHAAAQYDLGYMYRSGKGVEQDIDEAVRWFTLAAQQGNVDAREDLATLTSN